MEYSISLRPNQRSFSKSRCLLRWRTSVCALYDLSSMLRTYLPSIVSNCLLTLLGISLARMLVFPYSFPLPEAVVQLITGTVMRECYSISSRFRMSNTTVYSNLKLATGATTVADLSTPKPLTSAQPAQLACTSQDPNTPDLHPLPHSERPPIPHRHGPRTPAAFS